MASRTLLTDFAKLYTVENMYYAPSSTVPPYYNYPDSIYCFLSSVDPWDDDDNPPTPKQDQQSLKSLLKRSFVSKKVTTSDICPVIQRIDWSENTVYDYYQDNIDMFEVDDNDYLIHNFYIKNRYDQIFKCLWNANGAPSVNEPFFEPGTYGTNNIYMGADGYKWKYIYTIDSQLKIKFLDSGWLPVPIGIGYVPNPLINPKNLTVSPGIGNIDVINVLDGGSLYDPANSALTVTVTGDGTGAAGTAVVEDGIVTDIIVTNTGTNYSYANASISSANGSGAILSVPVSPIGGHGLDPISELGCTNVMITCQFDGSESGVIPTDITYYQIGLVVNPISVSSSPDNANGSIYKTSTDLIVASGFGLYESGEYVYQGTSLAESTFSAEVLSFDQTSNIIKTINTKGTITNNAPVFGNLSRTVRTVLSSSSPNLIALSGYPIFLENRSGIQRSDDGTEQFKIVLGY